MKLTDQQLAIVHHLEGPALVFAVAGAGKTTCMVYRINHLIQQKMCRPQQILATSFNTSAVADIVGQLQALKVPAGKSGVDCRTLHSLGYRVIRGAVQRGYMPRNWLKNVGEESIGGMLVGKTLTQMAIQDGCDISELDIDREDLKNQIAIWKGNLAYASLAEAELPEAALEIARQATHDNSQYLRAYRIYENLRQKAGIITFDDMLMTGWELLMRHPDILQAASNSYRSIIVDEFQDVNFAQYKMLDLLSEPHRNYMAIGDDDQCIYEWRGANPAFILNFEKTYGAKVYTISDNFRSSAQQILPANAVISKNKQRYPKFLSLTRGFEGDTHLIGAKDELAIGRHIATDVEKRRVQGQPLSDMAVLIRLYSQTAFLETALMELNIPYEIVGAPEFYKRDELMPLFQYISFAFAEKDIQKNGFPQDEKQVKKYLDMFANIVNKPRRYISREVVSAAQTMSRRTRRSLIAVLKAQQEVMPLRVQENVDDFCEIVHLITVRLKRPAHKVLQWLVEAIGYEEHLLYISGQSEVGQTRVQTVRALIEFARLKKTSCREFLDHIREITLRPPSNPDNLPPLQIMTIYKAKGLEWTTVYVPGSSEGLAPFILSTNGRDEAAMQAHVEAERRLFYVAMTRAKQTLYLHYPEDKGISAFLDEIEPYTLLEKISTFKQTLKNAPAIQSPDEREAFIRQVGEFRLERYFKLWSDEVRKIRSLWQNTIRTLELQHAEARRAEAEYEAAMANFRKGHSKAQQQRWQLEQELRSASIIIRKFKSAYYKVEKGQLLHFEYMDDGTVVALASGMTGIVDFDEMPKFDRAAVHWERSTVIVEQALSDTLLEGRFTTLAIDNRHLDALVSGFRKPSPPSQHLRRLLDPAFERGFTAFLD